MENKRLNDKFNDLMDNPRTRRVLFWLIMAAAVFVRAWQLGTVPNGINQDEAFAGYEAWSLLNYGIDTAGYHNPVYLTAWGSGMNALETYLMMPFIAIFGLEVWVIRLPQMIVACLSVWVMYLLVRRTVSERAALFAMFMLAICPWHILMSRWGLESNLAPGFLLFGLYFFVRGLDNQRFFLLSALMYGLCLYTYATVWVYVPIMLVIMAAYCIACHKLKFDRNTVFSVIILAVLAAPLLLFLAVNYGWIDEIRTPLFSIPKLLYMRASEISLDEKAKKLELIGNLLIEQNDLSIWNSPTKYGLLYYITMPFALFGLIYTIANLVQSVKEREFCPEALLLVQLMVCLPQLILVKTNVTRSNMLFIPLVTFAALGAYFLSTVSRRKVLEIVAAVYLVLFVGFETYYFTEYDAETRSHFSYGLDSALELAQDKGDVVYLDENEFYTKVLFYAQTPVDTFRDTVQYLYYPSAYLHALSFDNFCFWADPYHPEDNAAYIMLRGADLGKLPEAGFSFEYIGEYVVAYKE